jgi:hypothetical protein
LWTAVSFRPGEQRNRLAAGNRFFHRYGRRVTSANCSNGMGEASPANRFLRKVDFAGVAVVASGIGALQLSVARQFEYTKIVDSSDLPSQ